MKSLLALADRVRPHFGVGGKLARWKPLFDAIDTFAFSPATTTRGAVHLRDAVDLKRVMATVVVALVPCMLIAAYNTGLQAHLAIEAGGSPLPGVRSSLFGALGLPYSSANAFGCLVHGALYFVPALAVTFGVGGAIEVAFATVRRKEVNEGLLVTGFLFPLTLPPAVPLWQVAIGIAFGVIFAKEIFGGTGMNFLNPALTARAFLFFSYPAQLSGDVWIAARVPDGTSGATALSRLASGDATVADLSFWDAASGLHPGSMGETSAIACALGAALLLLTRIASWRTMLGVVVGALVITVAVNATARGTSPMMAVPFHWHIVLGGFAFGTVFMATDPVSSAFTDRGKLAYGFGIGAFAIAIRTVSPAYPEGMMLAILFMNVAAPLIDHVVVAANIRLRRQRYRRGTSR